MVNISRKFILSLITLFVIINLVSIYPKFIKLTQDSKNNLTQALDSIYSAENNARSFNLEQAAQNFSQSKQYFTELESQTWIFDNQFLSPDKISQAGRLISQVGENLIQISSNLKQFPDKLFQTNKQAISNPNSVITSNITNELEAILAQVTTTKSQTDQALEILQQQKYHLLPSKYKTKYQVGVDQLTKLQTLLQETEILLNSSLDLLGHQTSHRYLVLLQNQNELRPLGGFLGGVISFEMNQGVIQNLHFTDIYDIDGQTTKTLPIPPEFKDFTEEIFSRDANYSPSISYSSDIINDLHQHSKQNNHRTFIALNHSFLEKLLKITGPLTIQVESGPITLTSENFSLILNTIVEVDQNKNIVGDTIKKLENHILSNIQMTQLSQVIFKSIQDRDIQFYTHNTDLQNLLISRNILPQFPKTPSENQDHLLITHTNIGGNKSDKYIQQSVTHTTKFLSSTNIQNTIQLTRTHTYSNQQEILNESVLRQNNINPNTLPDHLKFIMGRGDNKSAIKIYVPKGSELISFQGDNQSEPKMYFDESLNQNYILFTQHIQPGQTKTIQITYKPNLNLNPSKIYEYSFLNQKPSGYSYNFTKVFQGSDQIKLLHSTTPNYQIKKNQINFKQSTILNDMAYQISLSKI